jgi:hypothetical protein
MDVSVFCESAGKDLIAWKTKLYAVVRKTENLSQADRDKISPLVKNLNELVDDIDQRIKLLAEECPLEWDAQKIEIQEKLSQVKTGWKDLDGAMDVWNMNLETH